MAGQTSSGREGNVATALTAGWRGGKQEAERWPLILEPQWLATPAMMDQSSDHPILVSRWAADEAGARRTVTTPADRHVLGLSLSTAKLRLATGTGRLFDGVLSPGSLFVLPPAETLHAAFTGGCDIIHLHVESGFFEARRAALCTAVDRSDGVFTIRDSLSVQLLTTLVHKEAVADEIYTQSVAQAVLTRYLCLRRTPARIQALPAWRLKRVQALIDERLGAGLSLADLAASAGLSRMHFAAQFKAATGYRPHEYLLSRRIEASKRLLMETASPLADVALSVGFQAQAHFTTVFRQVVGETPGRWRRSHETTPSQTRVATELSIL